MMAGEDREGDSEPSGAPETIIDNTDAARYEIAAGSDIAFLRYRRKGGRITLIHTEVPAALRGRGVAATLAKTALEAARAAGLRVVVLCPYVRAYVARHPEYLPVIHAMEGS